MTQTTTPTILVCDDDPSFHFAVRTTLKQGYQVRSAYNCDEALVLLRKSQVDVLLLDIELRTPEEGLQYIPKIREIDPELPILMTSGRTDFRTVAQAIKLGASDYLAKSFEPDELPLLIEQALDRKRTLDRAQQVHFETQAEAKRHVLIGESNVIQDLHRTLDKFRGSPANVLIYGETGTGKEVVARQLRGTHADGTLRPFVAIDSSTIQSTMAESILFGHEKGAFTGADKANRGVFEEAHGGVVYFDEVANMPPDIQNKLLRVLQEKEVTRLGSAKVLKLDFRVVCATNQDLDKLVEKGLFKADLLQRLNVLPIHIAPLKERKSDIPLLVEHFVRQNTPASRKLSFAPEALEALCEFDWPGNIRELNNVVAYILTMVEGDTVEFADLPPRLRSFKRGATGGTAAASDESKGASFYERVGSFEKKILVDEYNRLQGNISKLALELGMDRSHLYTKLKEHGIHSPTVRR